MPDVQDAPDWSLIFTAAVPTTTVVSYTSVGIAASSSGATELVAAVSAKKIVVHQLSLVANAAVNAKFQSDGTPTDLTKLYYLAANGGIVLPWSDTGWFRTLTGEALDVNLSNAIAVGGSLTYSTV
jgi:hypothetical protein